MPPTPTLWSALRDFFWVACLTLYIQQRAWALEVARSYNPIQRFLAFSLLLLKNSSGTDFTQEKGNFHPNSPPFHHTVSPDDHLQEAGPHFDKHEKDMKNAF